MTSWSGTTLAATMAPVINALEATKKATQKELAAVNAQIAAAQKLVDEAKASADLIKALEEDAEATGIFQIDIEPQQGAWNSILLGALNVPAQDSSAYTAIYCMISITSSFDEVKAAFDKMGEALTAVIPDPPKLVVPPSFSGLISDALPIDKPEPPAPKPANQWNAVTMGDIAPGVFNKALAAVDAQNEAADIASKKLEELQKKADELSQSIADVEKEILSFADAGMFIAIAEPEATPSGSWYDRLTAAGEYHPTDNPDGYPPADADKYVTGKCIVVQAATFGELVTKFNSVKGLFG